MSPDARQGLRTAGLEWIAPKKVNTIRDGASATGRTVGAGAIPAPEIFPQGHARDRVPCARSLCCHPVRGADRPRPRLEHVFDIARQRSAGPLKNLLQTSSTATWRHHRIPATT